MRAVALAQVPGALEVTEVDTPRPEGGELLVRVAASSVNGFDLGTAAGYPTAETLSMLAGQVASAALKVSVTSVYDLEQAPEAFAAFGAGTVGKIALTVA